MTKYFASLFFDEEIEVGVRTSRIGNSSLTFQLGVFRSQESDLLASGEIIWVNTDQDSRKSVPVPQALISKLSEFEK